ncbi:MAG: integrase core domain-containing protein [Candidatus Synoicihabitans palmerolidicus]|nr:integrase core domain-containing protein [Candidatus Synoicihabitans palmerolidicus]
MVERLWRSVKYEEVYLKRYETMVETHANLETYLLFYNDDRRPHSAHGRQTPSEVYHAQLYQAAA